MKHQKEWHTCDRCGKEIIPKSWKEVRFKQVGCCGDISGGYLTKTPCISKDDSIPEELRKNVEKELKD
nr:MAG TPA: acetyl-coA carboxylase zinc finger domain protein [Caudoviricetes sp.]